MRVKHYLQINANNLGSISKMLIYRLPPRAPNLTHFTYICQALFALFYCVYWEHGGTNPKKEVELALRLWSEYNTYLAKSQVKSDRKL